VGAQPAAFRVRVSIVSAPRQSVRTGSPDSDEVDTPGRNRVILYPVMNVPPPLRTIAHRFSEAGFSCFLVGGALRDMLQGKKPGDYDLATDAVPEQVMRLFRRVIPTGIKHGTVTILEKGRQFEVTTFRTELGYSDARHPDAVAFTPSIHEDLSRRDFTINSMALDLATGAFLDPYDGRRDLAAGIIRAIGNPVERFTEDALRPVRACRFAAQLEFRLEERTREGIRATLSGIRKVSAERIRDELLKMLDAARPSLGLECMRETGILSVVLPELEACVGVEQKGLHKFDVFTHSIVACDGAPRSAPEIRLAALFHDIGKPATKAVNERGEPTFHRHEAVSDKMTGEIMRRLRFPVAVEKKVRHLIRHHMFNYEPGWSDSAVRRFIARVGEENIEALFALRIADHYGMEGIRAPLAALEEFRERIARVLEQDHAFSLSDLAVNGNDLAGAGIPPGRSMGLVLKFLLETVLDDPAMNTREQLLEVGLNYYRTFLGGSA
jgi:tRNA nucleotidyltransferase (CCA-adding enzyme)